MKGWEKEGSDKIKAAIAKNDLVQSVLGDGEKQETFDGHPRLDGGRDVLLTWRTLAVGARGPHQTNAWCGKRLVTAPPHRSTRRAEQNTELRRHDRLEKSNLSLDHQNGCSRGGRPSLREDLRVPIRRLHQGVSKSNTCTGAEGHCSVPVPSLWGVTGQSGTTPHHAGDQKNRCKVEVRQQHCRDTKKLGQAGADPVRSQQKSTDLLRSHRLSSRGVYLWETPSRGCFATLSDGGRLFLNLFSNDRVGRAAQRLGVRAAFWNLRYGERYDVTHPVNL